MDVKGISWSRGDQEGARGVSWNGGFKVVGSGRGGCVDVNIIESLVVERIDAVASIAK